MEDATDILPFPRDPADRINALVDEICRVLIKHARSCFIGDALLLLLWNRITRLARRFASVAGRVRSGKLAEPAPAQSREAAVTEEAAPERPRVAPAERLSRRFGWLVHMLPEAGRFGADLCSMLQRVEMEELIFASPQVGRILRPLCRMLGVEPTAALRWSPLPKVESETVAAEAEVVRPVGNGPADDGIWGRPPYGFPSLIEEPEDAGLEDDPENPG
jgi:hypothetical protein